MDSSIQPRKTVTISSLMPGESKDTLEVTKQVQHTSAGILSAAEADTPCADFGDVHGLLARLNEVVGTQRTIDAAPKLRDLLQRCLDECWDLGTAYAFLEAPLEADDCDVAQRELDALEAGDVKTRADAFDPDTAQVVNRRMLPRRVWDLHANRVVPSWLAFYTDNHPQPVVVSHSWMDWGLRHEVVTRINARAWAVPIPKDTTLDRVRVELLNIQTSRYAWLDVLCLRQGDPEKDPILKAEWKIDVPTIGNIYEHASSIVYYYSGLGRPFRVRDLDHERHWLNRAWTLQETRESNTTMFIAGIVKDSPLPENSSLSDPPIVRDFWRRLTHINTCLEDNYGCTLIGLMRHRAATNELDKVAGLAFMLCSPYSPVPAYMFDHPEDAWARLVRNVHPRIRGDLFFRFPRANPHGQFRWCPSWQQVKDALDFPEGPRTGSGTSDNIEYDERTGTYSLKAHRINDVFIEGLSDPSIPHGEERRQGRLHLKHRGQSYTFNVFARHLEPIPDGLYTLIGGMLLTHWVVGRLVKAATFEKVSVVTIYDPDLDSLLPGRPAFRPALV